MKLEKLENRPLEKDELLFREAYRKGPVHLWEKPMNYHEYEQYSREGLIVQTDISHFYREKSKDAHGVTIDEVSQPTNSSVSVHRRYSYPVLHNHNYIEIVYIAAGSCVNLFENSSFPMKAGDVCILAPSSQHALSCVNDESCIINMMVNRRFFDKRFLSILQGGELVGSYLKGILFEQAVSPYILFPTGDDAWLRELARRMLTEITRREYGYEFSIPLLIGQFLLQLVREYECSAVVPGKSGRAQKDLIVAILNYLKVYYNQASLTETARHFGYSTAYLSRMIRDSTGKTFNEIIAQIQVETAVKMMDAGYSNLTQIAQEIGCFDTSHFNKKFKAAYGISPRQYLEQKTK